MIKVILWDLDGTLLDFDMAEANSIRQCFSLFELGTCTEEMLQRYSQINCKYWEGLEKGFYSKEETMHGRFREFFTEQKISWTAQMVQAFNKSYQKNLGEEVFFRDNSYELVKELKSSVKQYAVTNGAQSVQERKLEKSGFDQLFDGVFISDCVGYEKPNIKYFDHVLEKIGSYRKDEILIVGDSLTSDMRGGNNAGIRCCWYNPKKKKRPEELKIDYEIENLKEVADLITCE